MTGTRNVYELIATPASKKRIWHAATLWLLKPEQEQISRGAIRIPISVTEQTSDISIGINNRNHEGPQLYITVYIVL